MAIKNEDAMRDLIKLKRKAISEVMCSGSYWSGVFIGTSGAYMQAGVITFDQYTSLHNNDEATSAMTDVLHDSAL